MRIKARVYDNGGKTADRYTLVIGSCEPGMVDMFGFDENPFHPLGFGQYAGSYAPMRSYSHLGRVTPIEDLPDKAREYVNYIITS